MWVKTLIFLVLVYASHVTSTSPPIEENCDPKCNDPNEIFRECAPTCPPGTCDVLWKKYICPPPCDAGPCQPRCVCRDGYLWNVNKVCVPERDCLRCQGPNEYWDCGPPCDNRCDNLGDHCHNVNEKCTLQCYCKKGFARNPEGICIPENECQHPQPKCPGPHEHWTNCGSACPKTCGNLNVSIICIALCIEGCFCDIGYVRNHEGKCVLPNECFKCRGPHEVYGCGSACDTECATLGQRCPIINIKCNEKCYCEPGYARNKHGICIPIDECPGPRCKPNEHWDCGPPCDRECPGNLLSKSCGIVDKKCTNRCYCNKGFVRDHHEGTCIPENQCPPKCPGPHEHYEQCGTACPKTCRNYRLPIACIALCVEGCFCDPGYVRNHKGICVLPTECFVCPGPHEIFECGSACDVTCATLGETCPIINIVCNDKCYCERGYARDKNHICIPIKHCPVKPHCDGENEEFKEIGTACPDTCRNYNLPNRVCPVVGVSGCFCKRGYVRNHQSKCVKPDDCFKCKGPHEFFDCGSACDTTCATLGQTCPIINIKCNDKCYCENGFARNKNGVCIPIRDCKETPHCSKNEVFHPCPPDCYDESCDSLTRTADCIQCAPVRCVPRCVCKKGFLRNHVGECVPINHCFHECRPDEVFDPCPPECNTRTCDAVIHGTNCLLLPTERCYPACVCKNGLYRNLDGKCVSIKDCLRCKRPNEVFDCGSACDTTCDTLGQTCPIVNIKCNEMCYCRNGFARDCNGVCIPIDHCPTEPHSCGVNERYTNCGSACPDTCDNYHIPGRLCTMQCVSGCFCLPGFVRNSKGVCVHPRECPPRKCGKNEIFDVCGTACPRTCDHLFINELCIDVCVEGCFCAPGYVRNAQKQCVKPEHCPPKTCGINEVLECPTHPPRTCKDHDRAIAAPIAGHPCKPECVCRKGFLRNEFGVCVIACHCHPHKPVDCKQNEVYLECGTMCPETCNNRGLPRPCCEQCVAGCFCREGLIWNDDGICVLPADCNRRCGINEVFSAIKIICPPQVCESLYIRYMCAENIPSVPGCNCLPGFLRDHNKVCIPIDHCPGLPVICSDTEEYLECGPPCVPTCEDPLCLRPCSDKCVSGCFCHKGLVRNHKGECVHLSQCPPGPGRCGINEIWDCESCPPRTCEAWCDESPCECPATIDGKLPGCKPECVCEPGFRRNCAGQCVIEHLCCPEEPCDCEENEEFLECGTACPDTCFNMGWPRPCTHQCVRGCFCIKGYVRGPDGCCIRPPYCPGFCGEHETYSSCGPPFPHTCANYWLDKPGSDKCTEGCFCNDGYVRRADGRCVKPHDCTICAHGEIAKKCGHPYPDTCWDFWIPKPGTDQCILGCFCIDGHARDYKGNCIPIPECPKVCHGPHEIWSDNAVRCPPQLCSSIDREYDCPPPPPTCLPGCVCEDGYLREDETGICIPIEDCKKPPCKCGVNEIWDCESCPPRTCEAWCDDSPQQCPATIDGKLPGCKPECVCEPGFRRNCAGQCVIDHLCCPQEPCDCVENEVFLDCGTACPDTCFNVNESRICTDDCVRGCFCEEGFIRGPDGCCIRHKHCPKRCPGVNEEWSHDSVRCPPQLCSSMYTDYACQRPPPPPVPGCVCKNGYLRNDHTGICVLTEDC